MVGWHHRLDGQEFEQALDGPEFEQALDGQEFEQALGDGEGQGSLACFSPWGPRELDTTEQLKNSSLKGFTKLRIIKPELLRFPKLKSCCEELSELWGFCFCFSMLFLIFSSTQEGSSMSCAKCTTSS